MNTVHIGDCREVMRTLIAEGVRVQCIVTSPPYFGLRDYGHPGQLGLESTPAEYVAGMVEVFGLARELLADDGVLWLNLGDSYAANRSYQVHNTKGAKAHTYSAGCTVPEGLKPKDLLGIPWRVAFALQQPREKVNIKDRIDRAWLAALVDGEGCMTIMQAQNGEKSATSFPPVLQVKMCDPQCIEKANQITGFDQCLRQDSPSRGGMRDTYQWRITGRRAADIAAEIYPFLLIKRKQATILWNHQMVRDSYETKRGQPMPAAAREKQIVCRQLIQRLNQKQPVDLPSWMVEPTITVNPGWYLRQDVIWHKPNPMPESVKDRCTKAHEYLFLLTRSERYYYDAEAIQERAAGLTEHDLTGPGYHAPGQSPNTGTRRSGNKEREAASCRGVPVDTGGRSSGAVAGSVPWEGSTRNRRSVWTIATQPYAEAHFATFPEALVEPCILAGSRPGDVIFDPFMGSGTVAAVAQRLGRRWLGAELNPAYGELIEQRTRGTLGLELTA